jgi:hypothetical protein
MAEGLKAKRRIARVLEAERGAESVIAQDGCASASVNCEP